MILSIEHKIVYYDIPKTGSISFEEYFRKNYNAVYVPSGRLMDYDEDMSLEQKLHRLKHRRVPRKNTSDFIKITTVRNPYDRVCSMYFFYVDFFNYVTSINDVNALEGVKNVDIRNFDNFLDYCIEVTENNSYDTEDFNVYCCFPCHKWMGYEESFHAIKLEEPHEGLSKLPFYNPNYELEYHNKSLKYPKWDELKNTERKKKVLRWAEKDFELFGYDT